MEATTIGQLFTDVLEEIFSHLSGSDLKNCALVCKDWNEVIGSSAVAMKKLRTGFCLDRYHITIGCELKGHWEDIKMQSSDQSYRQHQNLEVMICDGSLTQLPSVDRFNMSQVKSLDLNLTARGSIKFKKVIKLLSRMPLLQILTIHFRAYCTIDTSNALVTEFKKLEQLNLQDYSVRTDQSIKIFELIKADNVTELTYHTRAEHSDAEIDAVTGFIKSNKSLSKLNVNTDVFTQLHRRHNFSGMNLESLIVSNAGLNLAKSETVNENIRKSLIANAHSLTSLSFPSRLMSKEVLVVVFNRLRKLTTLDIDSAYDGDISWIYILSPNDIPRNLSLKTLKVDQVGTIIGLKAILQGAPQLKKLSLGGGTDEIMKEVATSAPRLVEMSIGFLREVLTCDQRFNELKFLRIEMIHIDQVRFLPSLLERCHKIEVFECHSYLSKDPANLIDILRQQKTLKHLRLNCGPAA